MLGTWVTAVVLFLLFPFKLVDRTISTSGYVLAFAFLFVFCIGAWLKTIRRPPHAQKRPAFEMVCNVRARRYLAMFSTIAIASMIIEIYNNDFLNLGSAYQIRSSRGQALLHGAASDSSIFFKISFLIFPVGVVYLCQELLFSEKPSTVSLCFFGLFPSLLSSLTLGGRATLFNAFALFVLTYLLRDKPTQTAHFFSIKKIILWILSVILSIGFAIYFLEVFFQRAEALGGPVSLLSTTGENWGVNYEPEAYENFTYYIGQSGAFIIFLLAWYLTQGIIISLTIFSNYDEVAMFGVYGVDLLSAVARRLDPDWTSGAFGSLLNMNVYGFYPSALGSLYIDFKLFGLFFCFLWGWFCGLVFLRYKYPRDYRWHLIAPFMIFGIIMSLVNTPVGYSNGIVTYFWLFIAFGLLRQKV